ncbi:MAG: 2Fe-2S iron-sulfur cluster-binding protein [Chloroflexi bacterium]|jgi:NADH dehydrogenase/NADH:ubiquinone oxidoreductase subunit G|nr:2Fe-2S iron-sulfur cluster-binding protein [Chloroflexota bacterium]
MAKVWIDGKTSIEVEHAEGINVVHLTVDDKEIAVSNGKTILEAVERAPGIGNIPALCHHPAVKPYGACRICTVEVSEDGGSKFKFVAACLYPVKEGLIVKTQTEKIKKLRKGIIELLSARCPNVKRIQELADEYGVEKPRFVLGDQDCILCGLCVRACQEIIGKSAISLVNRGIYKEVAAPFYAYELSGDCIGCGDCAFVCPTGAIEMGADGRPTLPKVKIPYAEIEAMMKKETVSPS